MEATEVRGRQEAEPVASADVPMEEPAEARKGKKRELEEVIAPRADDCDIMYDREELSDTDSEGEDEQDVEEKMRHLRMEIRKKVKAKRDVYNGRRVEANARLSILVNEISGINRGIFHSQRADRARLKKHRSALLTEIGSVVASLHEA